MPNMANGVYVNKPWLAHPKAAYPPQAYIGPFPSNQDRMITQALGAMNMTKEMIQEFVRPNLPQVDPFPPRFGYIKAAYSIDELVDLGRQMDDQRVDYGQVQNQINSTSRNTLGQAI